MVTFSATKKGKKRHESAQAVVFTRTWVPRKRSLSHHCDFFLFYKCACVCRPQQQNTAHFQTSTPGARGKQAHQPQTKLTRHDKILPNILVFLSNYHPLIVWNRWQQKEQTWLLSFNMAVSSCSLSLATASCSRRLVSFSSSSIASFSICAFVAAALLFLRAASFASRAELLLFCSFFICSSNLRENPCANNVWSKRKHVFQHNAKGSSRFFDKVFRVDANGMSTGPQMS